MAVTLEQLPDISEGDVEFAAIDFTPYLDGEELLNTVSSVVEVTTADLTISGEQVSVAALEILGRTVVVGRAAQFTMSGQQSGTTYRVRVTVTTDAGRTKVVDVLMVCV